MQDSPEFFWRYVDHTDKFFSFLRFFVLASQTLFRHGCQAEYQGMDVRCPGHSNRAPFFVFFDRPVFIFRREESYQFVFKLGDIPEFILDLLQNQ